MFNNPIAVANLVSAVATYAGIFGAALVLFAAIGGPWASGVIKRASDERISNNEVETARAKEAAALANADAVTANLELERLRAQVSWRELSPESFRELTKRLSVEPSVVRVSFLVTDQETQTYATQLAAAFEKAGWTVLADAEILTGSIYVGVHVPSPDTTEANLVRDAFKSSGIDFGLERLAPSLADPRFKPARVTVFVGSKPRQLLVPPKPEPASAK